MSIKSDNLYYGLVTRTLHWSIATLILILLFSGFLSEDLPRPVTMQMHKAIGILVLGLSALRVLWWMADTTRPGDQSLTWEKWPSRLTKWILLALTLAMPLSGWLMSSAAGRPFTFFGLADVPLILAQDKAVASLFKEMHETLALVVVGLLALHILGALRHHILIKDDVLRRMLSPRPARVPAE